MTRGRATTEPARDRPHITYVLDAYPRYSERFITREIEALRSSSACHLHLYRRARGDTRDGPPDDAKDLPSRCDPRSIAALGVAALRHPVRIASLVADTLGRRSTIGRKLAQLSHLAVAAWLARRLRNDAISRGAPDELPRIHAHFAGVSTTIAVMASRLAAARCTFSTHANDLLLDEDELTWKVDNATAVFACSEWGLATLRTRIPSRLHRRTHYIPHGIPARETTTLRPRRHDSRKWRILVACRLEPKKGVADAVAAVSLLHGTSFTCRLTIAGGGSCFDDLRRQAAELGIGSIVTFTGVLRADRLAEAMRESDVLVQPSAAHSDGDRDGIPNVILEAFAAGLPVLATNVGGIPEVVRDGETGLLVPPSDPEALARALREALGDTERLDRITSNAFARVTSRFDPTRNARRLLARMLEPPRSKGTVLQVLEATIGGTRRHMRLLLNVLSNEGYDVTLICSCERTPDFRHDMDAYRAQGIRVVEIPMKRRIAPLADVAAFVRIWLHLAGNSYDVLHAHSSKAGVLARVAAKLARVPVVLYTPHAFSFLNRSRLRSWTELVERCLGRWTHRLVAVSPSEAKTAVDRRIIDQERVVTIPNAIETSGAPDPPATRDDEPLLPIVGTVAHFRGQKGLATLLEAARVLTQRGVAVHYSFFGSGRPPAKLRRLARKARIPESSFVSKSFEDDSVYERIGIFVLPSRFEGLSYALLEAARARLPIVTTDVAGNSDFLVPGTGRLVPPHDPVALADAIAWMVEHPAQARAMGRAARAHVQCKFNVEAWRNAIQSVYRDALGSPLHLSNPDSHRST